MIDAGEPAKVGFIGKKLGRFLIEAELGRGGMATVYRARDPQLGRDVAVKVMHGFFAGRTELEARFRREANAVAAIRHPSILSVYDFVPPAGEEPGYIVSELIEGTGLRGILDARGGRLLPEVALCVAIPLAEALGAAHGAGIVHRDVKPDNVLVDRAGGGARVVLTDFGVAHISHLDTMTATGAVLGSPAYMSPEQARGDDVGPPSDVFSLGVVLYQLCTGHLPFQGKDPLTVITAILRGAYRRPSEIEPRVGPDLERVIMRCLDASPQARFPNAAAVAAAWRTLFAASDAGDETKLLPHFLADGDACERELSPRVARTAVASAEAARRRGQVPRALAEVGRALAYEPGNVDAQALLQRIGAQRRGRWLWLTLTTTVGAIVVAALIARATHRAPGPAASAGTAPEVTKTFRPPAAGVAPPARGPETPDTTATHLADRSARDPSTVNTGDVRPGRAPAASTSARARPRRERPAAAGDGTPGVAGVESRAPRPLHRPGAAAPPSVAADRASSSAPTPAGPTPAAPADGTNAAASADAHTTPGAPRAAVAGPPVATSERAPAAAATASVILRASHGFCEPSLDQGVPSLRANYIGLGPGPHEIYCTLPQGGPKVHVATYELRPGTRPSLVIVPGPDGQPVLGRPE